MESTKPTDAYLGGRVEPASDFADNPDMWQEAAPIETVNLKHEGDYIAGTYLGRESRGMSIDRFSGEDREQFVHMFEEPKTRKRLACWDKGGINYALKTRGVKVGEVVKLVRVPDEEKDGVTYSRFQVFRPKGGGR